MHQHEANVMSKKTDAVISGISKHAPQCTDGKINWETAEILQREKKIHTPKKSLGERRFRNTKTQFSSQWLQ